MSIQEIANTGLEAMKNVGKTIAEGSKNAAKKTKDAAQNAGESIFKIYEDSTNKMSQEINEMNKPMKFSAAGIAAGALTFLAASATLLTKLVQNKTAVNVLKKTGLGGAIVALGSLIAFDRFRTNKEINDLKAANDFSNKSIHHVYDEYKKVTDVLREQGHYYSTMNAVIEKEQNGNNAEKLPGISKKM